MTTIYGKRVPALLMALIWLLGGVPFFIWVAVSNLTEDRERENMDWKPIETAPKDGTRILVWGPAWHAPSTSSWYGADWRIVYELPPFAHQPTVWMPLPAPPEP